MFDGFNGTTFLSDRPWLLFALLAWSLFWKGRALWRSARRGNRWWFIGLLLVNSLGILEIVYLYHFGREDGI